MKRISIFAVPLLIFAFALAVWAEMGPQAVSPMPQVTANAAQAFVSGQIVVKGEGVAPADRSIGPGQKKIMAIRAAKVAAFREIAEIVDGVAVSGETMLVNASVQSDTVRTTVQGLIKGAQVVGQEYYDPLSETAVVFLSVPMTGPNGLIAQLLPQVAPMYPAPMAPLYQPPASAPVQVRNYDGLILDVRDHVFKPALINRVVTRNGEIIYDPAKVAQNILVERGAAEYTNDVGKAKALLGERGSGNPVVVKAGGVVKSTDALVEPEDASNIFSSNQSSNFLEGAKVVFVLK